MSVKFFIYEMQGKWILQRTIYYLNRKAIKNFRESCNYEKLDKKDILVAAFLCFYKQYDYICFDSSIINSCYSHKSKNIYHIFFYNPIKKRGLISVFNNKKEHQINYFYNVDNNGYIYLSYKKGNLVFSERTFCISNNLKNTISTLRLKHKLISMSFSSAIKINEGPTNGL